MGQAKLNKIIPLGVNAPIWVWVSTVTGTDWSEVFWVNVTVVLQELESGLAAGEGGKLMHFNATRLRIVNAVIYDYLGLLKDPSF